MIYKLVNFGNGTLNSNIVFCITNRYWIPTTDPANTDYQRFKQEINADETQLQDVDGNVMSADAAKEFISTLPQRINMANVINGTATGNGGLISTGDKSGIINIQTNETTAVTVDASQNVGIGTTTNTAGNRLYVVGNGIQLSGGTSAQAGFRFQQASSVATITGINNDNNAYNAISFYTGASEAARIDTSGNVGIGTTTTASLRLVTKAATSDSTTFSFAAKDSGSNNLFFVRSDGLMNTGLSTYSPYNFTTAAAANMFVDSGGTLYRSTSSLKYKKNVQDAKHGLTDVLKLRSVTYESKSEADAGVTFGGLIAEEVHEAGLTEFVQYAEDGTPDALAYGNMVSLCIKAIQEQQTMIEQLKAEVAALKGV